MAFVLKERWEIASSEALRSSSSVGEAPWGSTAQKMGRELTALTATIMVHGLLFLVLILHLFGEKIPLSKQASPSRLMTFDVGAAQQDLETAPTAPSSDPPDFPHIKAPVRQPQSPSEWQMVEVKVLRPPPSPVPAAPPSPAASNAAGPPSSSPGSGYDPYAGAAPDRHPIMNGTSPAPQPLPGGRAVQPTPFVIQANDPALVAFARHFMKRHPHAHGRATVRIRLSPEGRVLEVLLISGSLQPQFQDALRQDILGIWLTKTGSNATYTGPVDIGPLIF